MLTLPAVMVPLMVSFTPLFSRRVWPQAQALVVGAILAPSSRTVAACLRVLGLADTKRFERYHRVLSRDKWSGQAVSRVLLGLLVAAFAPTGPVMLVIDEHLERRRGEKIPGRDMFRDAARSSHKHLVTSSGLRWVCMSLVTSVPFAHRVWALPFLTVLAPSKRYHETRKRRHLTLTDKALLMILWVRRWLVGRQLVVVGDNTYSCLGLLKRCQGLREPVTVVTKLRMDAALFEVAPPREPGKSGRPRMKGERLPALSDTLVAGNTKWNRVCVDWYGGTRREVELATGIAVWFKAGTAAVRLRWVLVRDPFGKLKEQALLCTDTQVQAQQVLEWYVMRWPLEVTFEEGRRHLGIETQRQWSKQATLRTTPVLLGLYSLVALCAHHISQTEPVPVQQTAWYRKQLPTFVDALALLRRKLWAEGDFHSVRSVPNPQQIPPALLHHWSDLLCRVA